MPSAKTESNATADLIEERTILTLATKMAKGSGDREVVATISTNAVDRDGDVLLPGGMDAKEFRANPVMLFSHDSGALPIGRWNRIEKQGGDSIVARGVLATRPPEHPQLAEWLADSVLHLIREDVLRGVSVGFLIDDAREPNQRDASKYGSSVRRIVTKWRLVEVSIVPVPANQEALITAVSKCWKGGSMLNSLWGVPRRQVRRLDCRQKIRHNLTVGG